MKDLKTDDLEIRIEKKDTKYYMSWFGEIIIPNPGAILNKYFDEIMEEFQGHELIVDFSKFDYMNTSTVVPIIRLINELDKREIKTLIEFDRNKNWQLISFKALMELSKTMKCITIKSK